jgi:hypothetical protein
VTLNVGAQQVEIVGITPTDCGTGLKMGDFVDIRADASLNAPLNPVPLTGVLSVTCTTGGLVVPPGIGTLTMPALLEGLAEGVTPGNDLFKVDGQPVLLTDGTKFFGGEREDLVDGVHVQVRGTLNVASSILTASQVRLIMPAVRIVAPLNGGNYQEGESITLMGITATITPLTRVLFNQSSPPCNQPCQVRLVGYESGGVVYALRATSQGPAEEPSKVDLRGPVTAFDSSPKLTILGVVEVDVSDPGTKLYGATGGPVTIEQFFAELAAVTFPDVPQVTAKAGSFDGSSTITAPASVRIED